LRGRKNRKRTDLATVRTAARGLLASAGRVLGGVLVVLAVAAAVGWGSGRGRVWLYTSPTFAVENLVFEGVRHADPSELARQSGIELGDNIFDADILAAERALAANPWVRRVSIERDYPRTVVVRVVEHEPVALADLGGLYYVDAEGRAFKKLSAGEEADLPILRGVSREEYAGAAQEFEALFREALDALDTWRSMGLEQKAPASEVRVDRVDGLTLFCGRDAVAVRLGLKDYREKFERLDRLFAELARRGSRAEVIRLDNRNRPGWVAVQLASGGGEARQ